LAYERQAGERASKRFQERAGEGEEGEKREKDISERETYISDA